MRDLLSRVFYKVGKICSPEYFRPDSDDVYLVSYPRSGNTWVRAMVSEMLYGESGKSIKDLQFYVPDIYVRTKANDVIAVGRNVVKSHSTYKKEYKHVIYLVRDPRDVALSYYRYQTKLGDYDLDLDQFILDWVNGRIWPCSWAEHVNSWTRDLNESSLDMIVVKYEGLLANTEAQARRISEYLGCLTELDDLKRIVDSVSAASMRLKEQRGMPEHESAEGFDFVGPATSNRWLDRLSQDQANYILENYHNTMLQHGYC